MKPKDKEKKMAKKMKKQKTNLKKLQKYLEEALPGFPGKVVGAVSLPQDSVIETVRTVLVKTDEDGECINETMKEMKLPDDVKFLVTFNMQSEEQFMQFYFYTEEGETENDG